MQTQSNNHQSSSGSKENDWNNSDNSNHSQIAISTQRGDFLVEQIKGGAGEQSTYFLSPLNGNKIMANLRRGLQQDSYANAMGKIELPFFFHDDVIHSFFAHWPNPTDENIIGLDLQEILPDNNLKAEKMLTGNPPNILKRAKVLRNENSVSTRSYYYHRKQMHATISHSFIQCKHALVDLTKIEKKKSKLTTLLKMASVL